MWIIPHPRQISILINGFVELKQNVWLVPGWFVDHQSVGCAGVTRCIAFDQRNTQGTPEKKNQEYQTQQIDKDQETPKEAKEECCTQEINKGQRRCT